jgi:CDGSH-type Zn-finger protein
MNRKAAWGSGQEDVGVGGRDEDILRIRQAGPYAVQVVEGREYRWCACGLSANQPWCDDSHGATSPAPISFVAPVSGIFYMCGCKQSENKPYCFGNCRGLGRKNRGIGGATR